MDLFATRRNAECALRSFLSVWDNPTLGVDAFAHLPWNRRLLYAFLPVPLIPRFLDRVQEAAGVHGHVIAADIRLPAGTPMAWGCSLSGGGSDQELSNDMPAFLGLAAERECLERLGLSQDVVCTNVLFHY